MFAAYGVTPNGDDPLSKALRGLIDHAARQDEQIERLTATVKAAGLCCPSMPEGDKLDSEQLNRLVE
jgi:serine O-acetyltransferase